MYIYIYTYMYIYIHIYIYIYIYIKIQHHLFTAQQDLLVKIKTTEINVRTPIENSHWTSPPYLPAKPGKIRDSRKLGTPPSVTAKPVLDKDSSTFVIFGTHPKINLSSLQRFFLATFPRPPELLANLRVRSRLGKGRSKAVRYTLRKPRNLE